MVQVIRRKNPSKKQVVVVEKKKQPIITTKYQKSVSKNQKISEEASKDYPSWIAVITGKISKLKDNCFEMPQASAQVFEKKVKE